MLWRQLVVFCFLLLACNSAAAFKVLFIGNSFIAQSESTLQSYASVNPQGRDVFGFEYVGGISLQEHLGRQETLDRLNNQLWDYVVLQDHSQRTIQNLPSFQFAVSRFIELVRQSGAEPILFMTWARLSDGNYSGDQATVSRAYQSIGAQNKVSVARVGDVWHDMYVNHKSIFELMFTNDGIHGTSYGAIAVASSVYRVMYPDSQVWAPAIGGNAGQIIRASSLRLNATRSAHYNSRSQNNVRGITPLLQLLLDS